MEFLKKILLLMFLLIIEKGYAYACNTCGGGSSTSIGLYESANQHIVGLQMDYVKSTSRHPSLFSNEPEEVGDQIYKVTQTFAKFSFYKNWNVQIVVPYLFNSSYVHPHPTQNFDGIGDLRLEVKRILSMNNKLKFILGTGIKLPTGRFEIREVPQVGIPNINTGTGSWDFVGHAGLYYEKNNAVVAFNLMTNLSSVNAQYFKYGNKYAFDIDLLKSYNINKIDLAPIVGFRIDFAQKDNEHILFSKKITNSGGQILSSKLGGQIILHKKIGMKATINPILYQRVANGTFHYRNRFVAQIFYLF